MEARPKRRRGPDDPTVQSLQGLLHQGRVSTAGLAAILKKVREQGLRATSQSQLKDANLAFFDEVRHVEELQLDDGSPFMWEFAHPARLMSMLVRRCPQLAELYKSAALRHPCSEQQPWHIIIGFDEFVPGSRLKLHNQRKCMNLHFNFAEIGSNRLCLDATWFTPICVRHSIIEQVKSGWSQLLRMFLRVMLISELGMSTAGVPLDLGDPEPFFLWAKLAHVLADGEGFRMAWEWNGANGLRPCLLHKNVLKLNSDLAHRDPGFVEISCADPALFQAATPAELNEEADLVLAAVEQHGVGAITGRALNDIRKVTGLQCTSLGLLADMELRRQFNVINVQVLDWVHTALQEGTIHMDLFALLQAVEADQGVTFQQLEEFLKGEWSFPAATRTKARLLYQVFSVHRRPENDRSRKERLKCSASECLGLYGLLRHFCETRVAPSPAVVNQLTSFFAACRTIDVIKFAKYGRISMADASRLLQDAIRDHMQKHIGVYGQELIKPKHHWMFDTAIKFGELPFVLDTFIVERLHLRIKSVADPVLNTRRFERSVLASAITSQYRVLCDESLSTFGLRGSTARLPGTLAVVADCLESNGNRISVDDIVFNGDRAGSVRACASEANSLYIVVELMNKVADVSAHSARWQPSGLVEVWPVEPVELALAWYSEGVTSIILRM